MTRCRLRDLGIVVGQFPTGQYNAITDVPGVQVGHCTLIYDEPRIARTGVTMIVPREGNIWQDNAFAGFYAFNGYGEMTGLHWVAESGFLASPIGLTNSHQIGLVRDTLVEYVARKDYAEVTDLPVVAETYDGWLNDANAFHLTKEHVYQALASATTGAVAEGNVGGGTGTICYEFKGGIGTASRLVSCASGQYTVGVLVQTNYGERRHLLINGLSVGSKFNTPVPWKQRTPWSSGSVIIIIATDAPLLSLQCQALAKRGALGLARLGCIGHDGSGDIFLAFATGNHLPIESNQAIDLKMLPQAQLDPFFEAVIEAVEESVLNTLTAAETMTGLAGLTVHALPLDQLQRLMAK